MKARDLIYIDICERRSLNLNIGEPYMVTRREACIQEYTVDFRRSVRV